MDENTLRNLLADALAQEPPMGPVAGNALRAGLRLRRRRTTGIVSAIAIIAVIIGLLPVLTGLRHSQPAVRPPVRGHADGMGGFGDRPMQLTFNPDGTVLATADNDGTARLWSVATQREIGAPFRLKNVAIKNVAFSPDGKILATADADGTVRLWNVADHRLIGAPFDVSKKRVGSVAFSPDGRTLATGSWDGIARLWSVATRRQNGPPLILPGPTFPGAGSGFEVAFSPNGKLVLTLGDFAGQLWNVATHRAVGQPIGSEQRGIISAAFSPDGKLIGTSGAQTFYLWSVATQERTGKSMPNLGDGSAWGVGFTADGKILVTTNAGGRISQWSVATRNQIRPPFTPAGRHEFLTEAVSPDGKLLATTEFDGPARLWVLSKV